VLRSQTHRAAMANAPCRDWQHTVVRPDAPGKAAFNSNRSLEFMSPIWV